MLVLITYDISLSTSEDAKRLRKISNICQNYGVRVQNSVFEFDIDPEKWVKLKSQLLKTYQKDKDSLRFYQLGSKWKVKTEHFGTKKCLDIYKDSLII